MSTTRSPISTLWPAPVGGQQGVYVLHVVTWDLHTARSLAGRLKNAGVAAADLRVRGRRCVDGLQEAQVRSWRRLTTRWRKNLLVAISSAIIVGIPVGASFMTVLFGETALAAWVGGVLGGMLLLVLGTYSVWADHFQRGTHSRNDSRVAGHLCVTGGASIVRAEMLVATSEDVMGVMRLPAGTDPLAWDVD